MVLHFKTALLPDGWANDVRLTIAGGRITTVMRDAAVQAGDEQAGIGLPGIANLHSHAFQRGMAGLAERRGQNSDSFWTWRTLMYRFVDLVTPDDLEAIAAQAYVEMVEAGFTRIGEFHYLHHAAAGQPYDDIAEMGMRIAAAAEQSGIGLTLLPVFYAHSGFGGLQPGEAQARFLNDPDRYAALIDGSRRAVAGLDGAIVGIAPHSLRAVTPDEIDGDLAAGRRRPDPYPYRRADQGGRGLPSLVGRSPGRMAARPSTGRWNLVPGSRNAYDRGRNVGNGARPRRRRPVSDHRGQSRRWTVPRRRLPRCGRLHLGVGSDSNVLISLAEELRLLEYGQRLRDRSRNVLAAGAGQSTGRALFDAALAGGAQALGADGMG